MFVQLSVADPLTWKTFPSSTTFAAGLPLGDIMHCAQATQDYMIFVTGPNNLRSIRYSPTQNTTKFALVEKIF